MILVDSSVWIDFFRNNSTAQADWLDANLSVHRFLVGDLILTEVLQGFKQDRGFNHAKQLLGKLQQVTLGGEALAIAAAQNFRKLRSVGVTVRGTVNTNCGKAPVDLLRNRFHKFCPSETNHSIWITSAT